MYSVDHRDRKLDDGVFRIAGLGPGNYLVQLTTNPKETIKEANGIEPNPGRFFERRRLELLAGQTAEHGCMCRANERVLCSMLGSSCRRSNGWSRNAKRACPSIGGNNDRNWSRQRPRKRI